MNISTSKFQSVFSSRPFWLSFIAGGLSATGFAPLDLWPVALLMLALWIQLLERLDTRKAVFYAGWLFGLGHFIIGLNWIAKAFTFQAAMPEWLGYIAVVLLSLYLAVYPALAALGAWILGRNKPVVFIIALAGFWIITEWLRSWVFSGFIWNPLGAVGVDLYTIESIRYTGTYGYSGIMIIIAGLTGLVIRGLFQKRWRIAIPSFAALAFIICAPVAVAIMTMDWGNIKICKAPDPDSCERKITVVQPNIGQQDKWQAGYEEENFRKLAELTVRKDNQPRILFWPEAAIPDYLETGYPQRYYYGRPPEIIRPQLARLMQPGDVLVLGAVALEFEERSDAQKRAIGARNSVFAMDANQQLLGRYDKSHLVPYGEYLPMRPVLEAIGLSRLAPGNFDFLPGPGPRNLDIKQFGTMGLQLCYEIIFSGQVVDRDNRPEFIFNPSNDAWFGAWGPPQHLAQARLRAIEEGLPVIRSTPTGISAVINANGKVENSIAMGKTGRIDTDLPSADEPTLFARYGNILPLGFAAILLICAIAIRFRSR